MQRSERELSAATTQIGAAKADFFPKFSLTGFASVESKSTGNLFDSASRYWSTGPIVQWELFQAGSIRANVLVQNARQEQALEKPLIRIRVTQPYLCRVFLALLLRWTRWIPRREPKRSEPF
jgi:hypothetical protein